jgi:hypothetical protein
MSYRNPKQIVDTQSGQHVTNMIKTITDSYGKMANTVADAKVDAEKTKADRRAKQQAAEQAVLKAERVRVKGINTKTQNYATNLDSKLKADFSVDLTKFGRFTDIYNKNLRTDLIGLEPEASNKIIKDNAVILNIPDEAQKGLGSTQQLMDTYEEAVKKESGAYGSFYSGQMMTNAEGKRVPPGQFFDILTGRDDGTVVGDFDLETAQFTLQVNNKDGTKAGFLTPNVENSMPSVQVIPDVNKDFVAIDMKIRDELQLGTKTSLAYKNQPAEASPNEDGTTNYYKKPSVDVYREKAKKHINKLITSMDAGDAIALFGGKFMKNDETKFIPYKKDWDMDDEVDLGYIEKIKQASVDHLVQAYSEGSMNMTANFGTVKPPKADKPSDAQINHENKINSYANTLSRVNETNFDKVESVRSLINDNGLTYGNSEDEDGSFFLVKGTRTFRVPPKASQYRILKAIGEANGLTEDMATKALERDFARRAKESVESEIGYLESEGQKLTTAQIAQRVMKKKKELIKAAKNSMPMGADFKGINIED